MATANLEEIVFRGHKNILGTHYNTLEITMDEEISKRADCIIGVRANKACWQLGSKSKTLIQKSGLIDFELIVQGETFNFAGRGHEGLELTDAHELVLRKSSYISPRTAALCCSAAAYDIPRQMIRLLQNPDTIGILRMHVKDTLN